MRDFANASFSPDKLAVLQSAMEGAVSTLPEPVSSASISLLAESILRNAKDGELDAATLQRMALLELQITPR